ncbi:LytR/AlgR family response regulator transcription factor [Carboxylicivirga caseinilyticus]|uniref:LytR/AlgR family response regulator transcription factor n=1 Tax=Carboxylicivirga caseinilyticus TaxID=3417572 RepID=UPI003D327047|nr:response regulator transcription factor [Marinilabiliaceae bacterium A049]
MKLNCIVIDDEFPARELLTDFIKKVPNLELLDRFDSPLKALAVLQSNKVDLMFIDIQMPEISGIDFLKTLRHKPMVVITSAYQEYALEGYSLDVMDYLLKPFSFDRFMQSVNKAFDRVADKETVVVQPEVVTVQAAEPAKDYLLVKADYKIHRIKFNNIICIEGMREYVTYFCDKEKYVALESLRSLEGLLPEKDFIRVHKSYIINIDKITTFYGNQIKLAGLDKYIPIGKSYKDIVQKRIMEQ